MSENAHEIVQDEDREVDLSDGETILPDEVADEDGRHPIGAPRSLVTDEAEAGIESW